MTTVETTVTLSQRKKARIVWGRVLLAAVLSEVAVITILMAITMTYSFVIAPGKTDTEYNEFGQLAGYYVAPAAGAVTTFLFVLWVGRKLESNFVLNGVLVGVVNVLLTAGFLATARPEHRLMYVIAFVLRIIAGYFGGLAALKMFNGRQARMSGHA
jgi:hypothetical protein